MFTLQKYVFDSFKTNVIDPLLNPWSLTAAGTLAFVYVVYHRQKEAILLSEIEQRKDLSCPTCSSHNGKNQSNKPFNYATWIDRPVEYNQLCEYLKSPTSKVIVLLGIPQSGKSKLATKAILEAYPYGVTHIDIRNSPFDDVNGLEQRFFNKSFDLSDSLSSIIRGVSKTIQGEFDPLDEMTSKNCDNNVEEVGVESLNRLKRALRRFKHVEIPDKNPHLLYINHMEAFSSLTRDKTGIRALEFFLLWLSNMTRDKRNIHVVLTCTPLFYFDWLSDIPLRDNFYTVALGELTKEEAKEAYSKLLSSIIKDEKVRMKAPSFDLIYEYFGGRIHDLSRFLEQFNATSGELNLEDYPEIGGIITKFTHALYPDLYKDLIRNKVNSPVLWERKDIIKTWQLLIAAKDNQYAIPYVDFIKEIPMNIFSSMFKHGIINYRPQSNSFRDIELCKKTETVLFRKPLDRIAVERILKNIDVEE
ncbi:hypothetical protein ABK040_003107 [Willaertia magna]